MPRTLLAFDFDGTLAPITDRAEDAQMAADALAFCQEVLSVPGVTLAVVSGRDLDDLVARTRGLNAYRSGSHGLELSSPDGKPLRSVSTRAPRPPAELVDSVVRAGMRVEFKRHGIAVHWRNAPDIENRHQAIGAFRKWAEGEKLQAIDGRLVLELRIPGPSKKDILIELARLTSAERIVYAGDDLTDFEALEWAAIHGKAFVVASAERQGYPPASEVTHSRTELFARLREFVRSDIFRSVQLPEGVSGKLFLHSMPGRDEAFETARQAIIWSRIGRVVCLTLPEEIEQRSPEYAQAIAAGVSWTHLAHPIADGGITSDATGFQSLVTSVADALRHGENVLVHCLAGIGRTGTFAAAVLSQLGLPLDEARQRVRDAGSSAESEAQRRFLESIGGK